MTREVERTVERPAPLSLHRFSVEGTPSFDAFLGKSFNFAKLFLEHAWLAGEGAFAVGAPNEEAAP